MGETVTAKKSALGHIRVCDFTGQLAGAGATRWMASFGAEVIKIEDPVKQGTWDILRGSPPFKDERRGIEFGSGFQNHNIEKLGITLNLRTDTGKDLLRELVKVSDVVAENFAAGVLERLGFGFEQLQELRPDVVYASNCGFGQTGPYRNFKSWGPIAQAMSGHTHNSGHSGLEPAGWGLSYLDHTGGYYMAIGILLALLHRQRTGEGQWVDMSCTEAGAYLHGAELLDWSVNGNSLRGTDARGRAIPASNRARLEGRAPHGVYQCQGDDNWVAIACRDQQEWERLRAVARCDALSDERFDTIEGRLDHEDDLDAAMNVWTKEQIRWDVEQNCQAAGIPAAAVKRPDERIDGDADTAAWGLWPSVNHEAMGGVRVDGEPVHFSKTDWSINRATPTLGQDNQRVFGDILGLSTSEIEQLTEDGVL
ncbi:MAG: benzylsuccinate CoA-transferase BbsF subunit [Candidatus Poriferisodalaceae bacterium]|jgi:benzylsuccinate CoA-transferase BbsF subunit